MSGVRGPTITQGIGDDKLRRSNVDQNGVITVDREVTLVFHGTERRDHLIAGEIFLGGEDENGGAVFYLREKDGMHRYELAGGGMRAKRVLLEGRMVSKFENPFRLSVPRKQWVKFTILVNDDTIQATFGDQSGIADGPLSTDGRSSVALKPGAKLRNVQVVKTTDEAARQLGQR